MIDEILGDIRKAEEQAEQIIANAQKAAAKTEEDNRSLIDGLRAQSDESVRLQIKEVTDRFEQQFTAANPLEVLKVPQSQCDAARLYILKAFYDKFIPVRSK